MRENALWTGSPWTLGAERWRRREQGGESREEKSREEKSSETKELHKFTAVLKKKKKK